MLCAYALVYTKAPKWLKDGAFLFIVAADGAWPSRHRAQLCDDVAAPLGGQLPRDYFAQRCYCFLGHFAPAILFGVAV
jgi:hypothetical protein